MKIPCPPAGCCSCSSALRSRKRRSPISSRPRTRRATPSFHQWLKPEEFGRLYGPADSDVAAVTAWLESHGLTVNQVHAGRLAIEFSGTAGQVSEAFQTRIHRYQVNGETHLANATDPSVPAALAPVIAGLAPLNDFHPQPRLQVLGQAQFNPKTHQTTPHWTYPAGRRGRLRGGAGRFCHAV